MRSTNPLSGGDPGGLLSPTQRGDAVSDCLSGNDAMPVLTLLGALHEAVDPDELSHVLVDELRALVECDVVSYNDIDVGTPATGGTRTWFEPEVVSRPELEFAFDALQQEHPLVIDYAATGDPAPRRMSDFIALPELRARHLARGVPPPRDQSPDRVRGARLAHAGRGNRGESLEPRFPIATWRC